MEPRFAEHARGHVRVLARHRILILVNVLIVVAGSLTLGLVLGDPYEARATIIIRSEGPDVGQMLAAAAGAGAWNAEAHLQGLYLYAARLVEPIVEAYDLTDRYNVEATSFAITIFRERLTVDVFENGFIHVALRDEDPQTAAAMLNDLLDNLVRYNTDTHVSGGRRLREFLETRMLNTGASLAVAEDALEGHLARAARAGAMTGGFGAASIGVAHQRSMLRAEIGWLSNVVSAGSPLLAQRRIMFDALTRWTQELPWHGLETRRLRRDVDIHMEMFALLSLARYIAMTEGELDSPVVQILDPAKVPDEALPMLVRYVLAGLWLGLIMGVAMSYAIAFMDRDRTRIQQAILD